MEHTRRISVEEDFMNWKVDDLLYGAMAYLATFNPDTKKLYLTKKIYMEKRSLIAKTIDLSTKTLGRHLEDLIKRGLIEEGTYKVNDNNFPCYYFPYDKNTNYYIIDWELLWYLVSTKSKQAVKIFCYLANRYKLKERDGIEWEFYNTQIAVNALGYAKASADNKEVNQTITQILKDFKKLGIIDYEEEYKTIVDDYGNKKLYPVKILKYVCNKVPV